MAKPAATPAWQISLVILASTVVGVVVTGCLYWAQSVCIPVALAIFLTFLLAPLVGACERFGLGRTASVLVVVLAAVAVLGAVGWVVGGQAKTLVSEMPKYTENITAKIKSLREMSQGPITHRLGRMVEEIAGELEATSPNEKEGPSKERSEADPQKPAPMVVQPDGLLSLSRLPAFLSRLLEALGSLALVSVLLVFMLMKREDLRNRLIRLIGRGRITTATKVLDEATQRVSRYLLMQLIVNSTFGLAVMIGLSLIGMEHAILWGFLGAALRYVPYIGPWIAASAPILLSLAMFPGWLQPLLVIGLFVVIELITNNLVEPRLYGRSIGVSETALLVAAAFWAFLWGPIGLVLSSPLTVCMVVLGKYVPHLEFLDVLMGDAPVLAPDVLYYQRLLAHDQDEAEELVLNHTKTHAADQVYDELLVPALNYFKRDSERGDLTETDEQSVLQATREILEDLGDHQGTTAAAPNGDVRGQDVKLRVMACPAHDSVDRLALAMLQQLLDPAKWQVEIVAVEALTSEVVTQVAEREAGVVCIGSLPPGGLAHTRYLCKRLRARFPELKIVVGRWGLKGSVERNRDQLQEAGAELMATTLLETRNQLNSFLPVLARQRVPVDASPDRQDDLRSWRADRAEHATPPAKGNSHSAQGDELTGGRK